MSGVDRSFKKPKTAIFLTKLTFKVSPFQIFAQCDQTDRTDRFTSVNLVEMFKNRLVKFQFVKLLSLEFPLTESEQLLNNMQQTG